MWQPLGLLHDQALRIHIVKFEISLLYCVRIKLQTYVADNSKYYVLLTDALKELSK